MAMGGRIPGLGGIIEGVWRLKQEAMERKLRETVAGDLEPLKSGSERLRLDGLLTRPEVAAYLGMSVRQVQRMEVAGKLRRCPDLGATVRYRARDVLRLASAR